MVKTINSNDAGVGKMFQRVVNVLLQLKFTTYYFLPPKKILPPPRARAPARGGKIFG